VTPAPDTPGFIEAQERLIDQLGTDVDIHTRVAPVYAADVQIDPESGEPYDPTAVPTSGGGFTTVTVRAATVRRLIARGGPDEVEDSPGGVVRQAHAAIAVKVTDHAAVADADEATLATMRYRITDVVAEQIRGTIYRYVVYLEAKS
jgi:hypothetical protein